MPQKYNIEHYRGDSFSQAIVIKSNGVTPDNLSGKTIIAQVRESTDLDAPKLLDFSVARVDAAGEVAIILTPSQTQDMEAGNYVYDLQIGSDTVLYGNFKLIGDVSR